MAVVGAVTVVTGPGTVEGVSIVYNTPTTITTPDGNFDESVAPGALRPALQRADVGALALLRDHAPSLLLARLKARTLLIMDDESAGLKVLARLPDTELGHETATLIRRGDLAGMSFAFRVKSATWYDPATPGGNPVRVITAIDQLFDVSLVTFPAYPATTAAMAGDPPARSADPHLAAVRARHARAARRMGLAPYGAPMRRPPASLESWARARPVRVGTEARRGL